MANSSSDTLHELIKSLSKSEKRFFKLFAGRHKVSEENNSILLFDFISRMDIYDENLIKNTFKGSAFLNKFSITKYRLYHLILDSLNSFYAKSSIQNDLQLSLQSSKLLFDKGLYSQSKKLIDSILKKADKHHLPHIKWQGLQMLRKYHEQHFYTKLTINRLKKLNTEENEILNNTRVKTDLWYIKSTLFKQINEFGTIRSKEQIEALKKTVSPISTLDQESVKTENKYLYHHILGAYYFAIHDINACYDHLKEIVLIYESDTVLLKKGISKYLSALTNLIFACIKLRHIEEADLYIDKLEKLDSLFKKSQDLEIKYFSSWYSLKLFLMIEKGQESNSDNISAEIIEGLLKYEGKINPIRKAYLYFQLGVYFMAFNDYKQALSNINNVLNDKKNLVKEDIYSFAQILQLIIHLELKNFRYLPYVLASTKRFLKEKNRLYRFEVIFLKIITKIKSEMISNIELEEILIEYEPEINRLREDKFESLAFEYFDFGAWLNSKILRKTYLEVKKASA
ncbi:MAG: hypothetical protein AB8B74_13490 [Crocinitomicaceae bacterium]